MAKEIDLGDMLKFTQETRNRDGVPSKENLEAIKRTTKTTEQYDRNISELEATTYKVAKDNLDQVSKNVDLNTEEGIQLMNGAFKEIATHVKHEDQIGMVSKAIADVIAPVPNLNVEEKFAQIDKEHTGLYSETTREIKKEEFVNSKEFKDHAIMEGVNRALTTIADVAVEKTYRSGIEEKLKAELGIKAGANKEINATVPESKEAKKDNEIPVDRKPNSNPEAFDVARVRETNSTKKRASRLKGVRSKLGSSTNGYFPYSGIKFKMNSTASLLEKEEVYTELEKLYNSNGLRNMSRFISEACKHIVLETGDTDPLMTHPGDTLRKKIHAYDFKYLLLYKAISLGETKVDGSTTCPRCNSENPFSVDLLELLKGWSAEQYRNFDNYDSSKKLEDLTSNWKKVIGTDTFALSGFDTEDGCIFDEDFKAKYNKIYYTTNYSEPTIEKYMNIKNSAFAIMIYTFKDSLPQDRLTDEDEIMDYINEKFGERIVTLQTIMESLVVIDSIKISYVYEDPKIEGPGVVVGEDTIVIDDMNAAELHELVNEQLDQTVIDNARDFLIKKYNLEERALQIELNKGYTREQLAGRKLNIPTLLEDIIFFDVAGITCPNCKHVHTAEVSSLWLGFELTQKAMRKMKN